MDRPLKCNRNGDERRSSLENSKDCWRDVQEGMGWTTDDVKTQMQGAAKQAEGAIQDL
jgi:hypothetical protein